MPNLPINSVTITLIITTVTALLLYIREYFLKKQLSLDQEKISQQTRKKSVELINAAQEAESQLLAEGSYAVKKLVSEFQGQLQNIVKTSQDSITLSQDQLIKFMKSLQQRSSQFEETSRKTGEQRINQLFERLETKLSDFLIQTEQKTTSSIELELTSTRQLIETYKNAQLKLIDENIVAMMEKTLNLVLAKKISLKDQLDLIYEALEKAKVEKFIL